MVEDINQDEDQDDVGTEGQEPDEVEDTEQEPVAQAATPTWGANRQQDQQVVHISTSRGTVFPVNVGENFFEAIERVSDEALYDGAYCVFLNGTELEDPEDAPELIEAGQRIALTAFDKVGNRS